MPYELYLKAYIAKSQNLGLKSFNTLNLINQSIFISGVSP